jgi:hypothetical protein
MTGAGRARRGPASRGRTFRVKNGKMVEHWDNAALMP